MAFLEDIVFPFSRSRSPARSRLAGATMLVLGFGGIPTMASLREGTTRNGRVGFLLIPKGVGGGGIFVEAFVQISPQVEGHPATTVTESASTVRLLRLMMMTFRTLGADAGEGVEDREDGTRGGDVGKEVDGSGIRGNTTSSLDFFGVEISQAASGSPEGLRSNRAAFPVGVRSPSFALPDE